MRCPPRTSSVARIALNLALSLVMVAGLSAWPTGRADAAPACPVAYVVKKGDSPWKVAQKTRPAGQTILNASKQIKQLNPKQSAWQIGKTICLPAGFRSGGGPSTPTTTAVPVTTVPVAPMSRNQIIQLIRDTFPDDVEEVALYVAKRESNYNPRSKNWCCSGLFQIYYKHHKTRVRAVGVKTEADLLNPVLNVKAAHLIWSQNGKSWGPWCTKGLRTKFPGLKGCS